MTCKQSFAHYQDLWLVQCCESSGIFSLFQQVYSETNLLPERYVHETTLPQPRFRPLPLRSLHLNRSQKTRLHWFDLGHLSSLLLRTVESATKLWWKILLGARNQNMNRVLRCAKSFLFDDFDDPAVLQRYFSETRVVLISVCFVVYNVQGFWDAGNNSHEYISCIRCDDEHSRFNNFNWDRLHLDNSEVLV